jgi:hypothetical protein
MKRCSTVTAHCGLSALILFLSALSEPVIADTLIRNIDDRTSATQNNSTGTTPSEPPPTPVRRSTTIRIIGDRQKLVKKPAALPEPDQSASVAEEKRRAAEKAEQERLALIKAEQEHEDALQAAFEQLAIKLRKAEELRIASSIAEGERQAAAKLALIENLRQGSDTSARTNKVGRRHKLVKKRYRRC